MRETGTDGLVAPVILDEWQEVPGTGRVLKVPMYGMSVREVLGRASLAPFIDRVIDIGLDATTAPGETLTIRDYLDLMLAGSFPEPSLRMPAAARRRWLAGYVEQMITREVPAVAPGRDPELLCRYLSVLAVNIRRRHRPAHGPLRLSS